MRIAIALAVTALLPRCAGDETLSGHGASDATWHLSELDGASFPARATLRFPRKGHITGDGPCNSFTGTQSEPYPWFRVEKVASTRRACPDLSRETAFFDALAAMTLAEIGQDILILSNTDGQEMIFTRQP
ncbi:MAG: META domain-containing protein [Pseudomonadota bacterium]